MIESEKTKQTINLSQSLQQNVEIDSSKTKFDIVDRSIIEQQSQSIPLSLSQGETLKFCADAPQTLSAALIATAEKFPDQGIVYLHSDNSVTTQSYKDLLQKAQKILTGLRKRGLQPQNKVILQLEGNQDFIEGFWACILGGFIPIPLAIVSPDRSSNDAAKALYHSWKIFEQPLILTNKQLAPKMLSLFSQWYQESYHVESIEDLRGYEWDETQDWYRGKADDLTLLFLNSRYGNVPKGVQLSHRNIISNIAANLQKGWINSEDTYLNWLPLCNPGPLLRSIIWTTYLGCQQIQGETSTVLGNSLKWLDWIEKYRVTITWAPNFAFALLNEHAKDIEKGSWDLSSVKYWLNTAEPIVPKTAQRFCKLLQPHGLTVGAMHGAWGMKETAASATDSNQYASECQLAKDEVLADLGLPLPGISLRIVNEGNQLVPEQTIGNLQVKGATVTSGYYQSPELNQEVFTEDGWYKTGDLGFLSKGRLTLTGRSKALIIINGKNHYSHEIEQVVEEIAGVEPSLTAACGIRQPGSNTDNVIIFFHTLISDEQQLIDLLQEIKKSVVLKIGISPSYLIPVHPPATIPKTSKGIIERQQLQQRFATGEFDSICQKVENLLAQASQTTEYLAPETEIELQLATIWQELLDIKRIGKRDNFFELGGNSLLGMQLYAAIEEKFARKLPLNTLFDTPTIEQLADFLKQTEISEPWDSVVLLKPGDNKTPLFMVHDVDGDVVLYLDLAHHLHPERPVYGLRPYGKEGFPILHTRMDEMVNHYIERIRSVQPNGPYLLSGLCNGGVIAYEVGQKLQEQGHQVGMIGLLDAIDNQAPRIRGTEDVKTIHHQGKLMLYRFLLDRRLSLPGSLRNQITVRMMMPLIRAGYVPKTFQGKLVLFKATEGDGGVTPAFKKTHEPLFGWDKRATEGVEVYVIPGNHSSILREPSVKLLAEGMETFINDAIG